MINGDKIGVKKGVKNNGVRIPWLIQYTAHARYRLTISSNKPSPPQLSSYYLDTLALSAAFIGDMTLKMPKPRWL